MHLGRSSTNLKHGRGWLNDCPATTLMATKEATTPALCILVVVSSKKVREGNRNGRSGQGQAAYGKKAESKL